MTIEQILARLADINTELETAEGEAYTTLETEARGLLDQLGTAQAAAASRQELRSQIAAGIAGTQLPGTPAPAATPNAEERAAREFLNTNRMTVDAEQSRATLVSSGTLATPTEVSGINDVIGAAVTSIIDMVYVENCVGMGNHTVAYTKANAGAAADQTEGAAATEANLGNFGFVEIKPKSVAVVDYISKQTRKQAPLQYATKVRNQAMIALRKKAALIVSNALKASELVKVITVTAGKIDEKTLRNLALNYGGDESVVGGAVLQLNKADLLAFGDVRGTNEKKAVYEITPDAGNPNTGIIRDGGLAVRYVINSNLAALSGAEANSGKTKTMFYGNPKCLELDLFSDYEISVSKDYAITKLMETIVGDVEVGADVIVQDGFITLAI